MASAVVGALRVILSADTAEFKSGLNEATKLTGQFSGKLTGLSAQVTSFSKVFGAMFTVGAITAAAAKVLDYAGKIQDLADQTGLTTDSIQEMGFAAKQTGSSLEGFTNAAFKLGVNLADGTQKIQGAVEQLGLSYAALKASSPDEQFRQTAIALSKVEDVQERNRLGVILMGKGYKEVAGAINEGYDEMSRRAIKSSAEQIKALSDAGDEWDAFKDRVLNLGVILGASFARAMDANIVAFKQDAEFLNKYVGIVRITQQAVEDWKTIFGIAAEGPPVFQEAIDSLGKNLPAALANQTLSMDEAEEKAKELDAQIEKSIETNKAAAKAAEEFAKALRALGGADAAAGAKEVLKQLEALGGPLKVLPSQLESMADKLREGAEAALLVGDADLAGQYTKLAETLSPIIQFQQRYNVTVGEYAFEADNAAEMTEELWEQLHRLTGEVQTIGPLLKNTMDLSKMFAPLKGTIKENLPDSTQWAQAWSGMKEGLSKTLGDIPQTLASAFTGGGDIMGALKSIVSQIGATIGGAIGSAFGPIGAKIGSAIGSMAGMLVSGFKKLFGIGINDEIRKFNKQIADSQAKLIDTYGSFERIDKLGKAVGVDLAGAWKSQGEAGKKHFDQLAKDFEAAVAKMESELQGFQGDFDDLIGKAADLGYEFDKAGNFVGVNFDKVKAKADEFGVSVDGLGPKFRQQGIDAEAKRIIEAFTLLDKAGGDTGGILVGLKDEIGALVKKSIELGTTIPSNMKPWIEELHRTHQLVDENGDEITDLSKLKFADPIKTEFEKISLAILDLIGKIQELIDKLAAIPTQKNVNVTTTYEDVGTPREGENHGYAEPGFASGTMGQIGKWFGNFGSGMGATLHGTEAVVTSDQAPAFAMDVLSKLGSQGSQTTQAAAPVVQSHIVNENRIFIDGYEMKSWIQRTITESIENNERGIRSRLRDGLGVTT